MTNYGATIGNIIGTAMILKVTGKHLLPANKKLLRKFQLKGGKKRR